jgi:hypothetical protein
MSQKDILPSSQLSSTTDNSSFQSRLGIDIPLLSSVGECNVPSYFQSDSSVVERCNEGMAQGLFKIALFVNVCFSLLFYKNISTVFMLGFVIFHIFLYYFTTKLLVDISLGEWKTYQAYKMSIKRDPDFSRLDTPLNQFKSITGFLLEQPINKQKMMYLILVISFLFVWLPIMFNIGESRFDISGLRKKLPFGGIDIAKEVESPVLASPPMK